MGTFLTTSKMHPDLAARIEARVRGTRATTKKRLAAPRIIAFARVGLVVFAGLTIWAFVSAHLKNERELARAKSELLDAQRRESASLGDTMVIARAQASIAALAARWDGDFVDPSLRGAAAEVLARPSIYVRGPSASFTSTQRIAEAATSSTKDALLLCLVDPPDARDEKTVLGRVQIAYGRGSGLDDRTPNARRLGDALAGLPLLTPAWAHRVEAAKTAADVERLDRDFKRAPIARAKEAARATVLVLAMDDTGPPGPTEIDGARAHPVRVAIVDLAGDRVLYRATKGVDPSWISVAKRPTHASGLDGCRLGYDIRAELR